MTRDPDQDPVPAPDDEPGAAEQAHARAFGDLIDRVVAGHGAPAAMSADDRALIEVATVIRGAAGRVALDGGRAASMIDDALAAAGAGERPRSASLPPPATDAARASDAADDAVIPITRRRRQLLPWSIAAVSAAVAAAAVAMLIVRRPPPARVQPAAAPTLPEHDRSRPADALVGVIPRDQAGDAVDRIDTIYADRLDGYRDLAFTHPRRARGGVTP